MISRIFKNLNSTINNIKCNTKKSQIIQLTSIIHKTILFDIRVNLFFYNCKPNIGHSVFRVQIYTMLEVSEPFEILSNLLSTRSRLE